VTETEDFPASPGRTVDSRRYYDAFLRAVDMFEQIPAKARGPNPDRSLHDLTLHLYQKGTKSDALFRSTLGASTAMAGFWLSQVRTIAEWMVATTELPQYRQLEEGDLARLAGLSSQISNIAGLQEILKDLGIILVYQAAIPGAKVDGCAFLLSESRPVIALSLRYTRVDYFWFTVMHELAHLCLHQGQLFSPILDNLDEPEVELVEIQANRLARDALIPRNLWRNCPAKYSLKEEDVIAFAESIGVAPQIVAGRLRKEQRRHDLFNGLVHAHNVRELLKKDA